MLTRASRNPEARRQITAKAAETRRRNTATRASQAAASPCSADRNVDNDGNGEEEDPQDFLSAYANDPNVNAQLIENACLESEQRRAFEKELHQIALHRESKKLVHEEECRRLEVERWRNGFGIGAPLQPVGDRASEVLAPPTILQDGELLKLFPYYNQQQVQAIARNQFQPENLQYFTDPSGSAGPDTLWLLTDRGTLQPTLGIGKLSGFESIFIWIRGFNCWFSVFQALHKERVNQKLISRILHFINRVIELHDVYHWQDVVLPLAIHHHRIALRSKPFEPESWVIDRYSVETQNQRSQSTERSSSRSNTSKPARFEISNQKCNKWNAGHCSYRNKCHRMHVCNIKGCDMAHMAVNHEEHESKQELDEDSEPRSD